MAHKTASGKQSSAWKNLENFVARKFKEAGFKRAKRILKETHESLPDVEIPEIPDLAIDTKYTNGSFAQHTQFMSEVETYVGAKNKKGIRYTWAIMPIRPGGSKDVLVVLRLEALIELLKRCFLREETGAWLCPRCPSPIERVGSWDGQNQYTCPQCHLSFSTSHVDAPEEKEKLLSQRTKTDKARPLIKNHLESNGEESFIPQPGQLTLRELIEKKQKQKKRKSKTQKGSNS